VAVSSSGSAALTVSGLSSGKHSISAGYTGDSNYGGATSNTISEVIANGSSATTTTLAASSTAVTAGTTVKFTAGVSSTATGTPTGSVTFSDNGTTIGTGSLSSGTATFSTNALAAGAHPITATYGGDSNFASSTSSVITVTVTGLPCDLNHDGSYDLPDIPIAIKQALGTLPAANDLNGDGAVNVVDIQIVLNAARGVGCTVH
jgi:hypothetical protein